MLIPVARNRSGLPLQLLIGALLSGMILTAGATDYSDPSVGLEKVLHPEANPYSAAKAELGRRLFFEKKLSRDNTVSCATCHQPDQAFAERGIARSKGVEDRLGRRNAPSLLNVAFAESLFADGRTATLESQAWEPILDPKEMGNASEEDVLIKLAASPEYVEQFAEVFGVERPDKTSVAQALACFQRTLLSGNAPFDRWKWGESEALTEEAHRGYELFAGRAQCWQCHPLNSSGALLFTDQTFHRTGVAEDEKRHDGTSAEGATPDLGRFEITGEAIDRFQFKTPSLRNVALTPPYMHDGSIATLRGVVDFYNRAEGTGELFPLYLEDRDLDALVAFLEALTGDQPKIEGSVD